jgi:hypothetical protein
MATPPDPAIGEARCDPQVVDAFFAMHGDELVATSQQSLPSIDVPAPAGQPLERADEGREDLSFRHFSNWVAP